MIVDRPSKDDYFLSMARVVSSRSTCVRRRVGCVLVDKHGQVMATGYNGVASGMNHCIADPCQGSAMPSGTGLSSCRAIHAEMNALIQCRDTQAIDILYCTTAPCIDCVKVLMNTSCQRICFLDSYPHTESRKLWLDSGRGRQWDQFVQSPIAKWPSLVLEITQVISAYGVE